MNFRENTDNFPCVIASPWSVSEISGMKNDIRTPDKLIDKNNQTWDDSRMWLAPFKNTMTVSKSEQVSKIPNQIIISFEKMVAISQIRIWNYSKTPERGANDVEILIDEQLIYKGHLKKAPSREEAATLFNKDFKTVILFS